MQHKFGTLTLKLRLTKLKKVRGFQPTGSEGDGKTQEVWVTDMLDGLEWPSLEVCRDLSSLCVFHKIHCGAVSIETDKTLTPAHS